VPSHDVNRRRGEKSRGNRSLESRMPVLHFTEIASPASGAERDNFEMFACEFLECLGFRTIIGHDRGPDAGRDLIVEEVRTGIAGETRVKWLVSCKHKAHSGASV